MKKIFLVFLLVICVQFNIFSQNTDPIDLILVLNSSTGMSSSYDNVNNYITGGFLAEFLRVGDTFHLIPFSESPRIDAARRISSQGDVETIVGRMLLQYPVESGSNLGSALTFTEQYIKGLPSRPKKIVVVSTGNAESNNLISSLKQRLGSNTTLDFVQVTPGQTLTNLPSSGRYALKGTTSTSTTGTATTGTTSTSTTGTATTGTTSTSTTGTTTTGTTSSSTTGTTTTGTTSTVTTGTETTGTTSTGTTSTGTTSTSTTGTETTGTTSTVTTGTETTGTTSTVTTGTETTGTTSTGTTGIETNTTGITTSTTDSSSQSSRINSSSIASNLPLIIGIIIGILLLLALIIFLLSRNLRSSPNRVMASVASSSSETDKSKTVNRSEDLAKYAAVQSKQRTTPYADRPVKSGAAKSIVINPDGPLLLNLFVEDQNTAIGKRNIHSLKSGYTLSVGGGNSDFLIFLVPVPSRIGDLRRNGSQLTFIPRKPKYFPDLGSNELNDCLNKTVRIISDKGYEMRFRFETYEDPLLVLNRMLTTINVPG